jgi:hypothetical protein
LKSGGGIRDSETILRDALVARIKASGSSELTIDEDYATQGNDEFFLDLAPLIMRKRSATRSVQQKAISRHASEPVIVNGTSMPATEC